MDLELLLIPALIFFGRILDTSMGTVRTMLVVSGLRYQAAGLAFVELAVWAAVIAGLITNLENPLNIVAFAGGFAIGTLIGMWIEERIALGFRVVHVVTTDPKVRVAEPLREEGYRVTVLHGDGMSGPVEMAVMVINRRRLRPLRRRIAELAPTAFVSVERADRPFSGAPPDDSRFARFAWRPLNPFGAVRK